MKKIINKDTIIDAIDNLRKRKEIFQSEAELKCGLSREIEALLPGCIVWHEFPAKEIKSELSKMGAKDRTNPQIDMVVVDGDEWFPIEVKYIKGGLNHEYYTFPEGNGKDKAYDFVADIRRIELFNKKYQKSKKGYALIVSNNEGWYNDKMPKNKPKNNSFDYDTFYLNNHKTLSKLVRYKSLDKPIEKENDKKKFFYLDGEYYLDWKPFSKVNSNIKNGVFKYILIEV